MSNISMDKLVETMDELAKHNKELTAFCNTLQSELDEVNSKPNETEKLSKDLKEIRKIVDVISVERDEAVKSAKLLKRQLDKSREIIEKLVR